MSTLPEFRRHLNEALVRRGLNVRTWASGGRHSPNLLKIQRYRRQPSST